ncbi:tRNA (uracil-O(2)-)-methyltransferase [Physcia stellaris]|nr:tRNA (uracil-O(2)-)-methyltransferase [Physcia stellaris]
MTSFDPDPAQLRSLQDKVIVLTGGANGIGAATVDLYVERGARVVFGDLDAASGDTLASKHDSERVKFLRTDVTKYEDNVALFQLALKSFGKVDHALSIAGIVEQGNIFDPALTIEDVEKPPTTIVLEVDLLGPLYFTRIATAYLKHNKAPTDDKSITLFSSVSGFCDSPGLFAYAVRLSHLPTSTSPTNAHADQFLYDQAAKHGILGLMRSLRHYLPPTTGIRINAIVPLATGTGMVPPAIQTGFSNIGVPVNTPAQVAAITLGLLAGSHVGRNGAYTAQIGLGPEGGPCNGLTVYVQGEGVGD